MKRKGSRCLTSIPPMRPKCLMLLLTSSSRLKQSSRINSKSKKHYNQHSRKAKLVNNSWLRISGIRYNNLRKRGSSPNMKFVFSNKKWVSCKMNCRNKKKSLLKSKRHLMPFINLQKSLKPLLLKNQLNCYQISTLWFRT